MNNIFSSQVGGGNDNISASMGASAGPTGASAAGPAFNFGLGGFGGYLQSMSAQFGGQTNDQGTTELGAQANLIGAGVTYDSDSTSARFGTGIGWGGGVRVHDGDKQGFGVDAGPISADYSSTTFGENMSRFGDFLGSGGHSPGMLWNEAE